MAELYANVPMGSGYPAAHELFMGVYHSHSIQIARLIERAYPFARPSPVNHFTFSLPPPLTPPPLTPRRIGGMLKHPFRDLSSGKKSLSRLCNFMRQILLTRIVQEIFQNSRVNISMRQRDLLIWLKKREEEDSCGISLSWKN